MSDFYSWIALRDSLIERRFDLVELFSRDPEDVTPADVATLSDVHGAIQAVQAVLDMQSVDRPYALDNSGHSSDSSA